MQRMQEIDPGRSGQYSRVGNYGGFAVYESVRYLAFLYKTGHQVFLEKEKPASPSLDEVVDRQYGHLLTFDKGQRDMPEW